MPSTRSSWSKPSSLLIRARTNPVAVQPAWVSGPSITPVGPPKLSRSTCDRLNRSRASRVTAPVGEIRPFNPAVKLRRPSRSILPSRASALEIPPDEYQARSAPSALPASASPSAPVARAVPKAPPSAPARHPSGSRVVMATTPPMASEPQSDPCGPDSTSIRCTSARSRLPKSKPPAGEVGSFTGAPSISTRVLSEDAPRICTEVTPPNAPERLTWSPGMVVRTSKANCPWRSWISWSVTTWTSGAQATGVGKRVAVTTSSSAVWAPAGVARRYRAMAIHHLRAF